MFGYMGRILRVDLSTGRLWNEPLSEDDARRFVGGSGLAAHYLYDMVDEQTDPLGPTNPLAFMAGPVVGTKVPSAGRYSVCALSPLTGIWGEANAGGYFGPELRFAGYDGIVITGQAEAPVWLSVVDGQAELHPAGDLWGQDTYTTQLSLRAALADRRVRVACIGPGGERLARMAAVISDQGSAAARTGMGTVMGAKKLKAVAVRGSAQVPIADPEALESALRDIHAYVQEDLAVESFRLAGTAGYVDLALAYGDMPARNFRQGEFEEGGNLSGVLLAEEYLNRPSTCYRCPIACRRETRAPRYGLQRADGPEYETLGALGTLLLVGDLEAVIYAGHLCNLYGLDTISTGATIALAIDLYEQGILTPADTGGLELRYGDAELVHSLIEMTGRREGLGDLLAEGSAALAARLGVPEMALTVRGLEVPMHDPRAYSGLAVSYALSPRGACHMEGDMYALGVGMGAVPELGIVPGDRFASGREAGRMAARLQAWRNLYNALNLCQFLNPGAETLLAAVNAITGWGLTLEDLMTAGKRIATLKRLLNLRRGATRAGDALPKRFLQALAEGGTEGNVPDMDTLLAGAYAEYGWDPKTGRPTAETLRELGLADERN